MIKSAEEAQKGRTYKRPYLENRPGSLAAIAAKLTKAGVNISYVYATACSCVGGCACKSLAIISAPNLKKVEAIAW